MDLKIMSNLSFSAKSVAYVKKFSTKKFVSLSCTALRVRFSAQQTSPKRRYFT